MKKLLFVFVVVLLVVIIVGCQARRKNSEFEENETVSVITTEETANPISIDAAEPAGKLAVISLEDNALTTNAAYNVIKGTAPGNTHAIQVNDYTLRQYRPGQTTWNYIASTGIGTLKKGDNQYIVVALNADGTELDRVDFEITYEPAEIPSLPGVGTPLLATLFGSMMLGASLFGIRRLRVK